MSGTKKTYKLNVKNYFDFFGIEEKFSISVRSVTNSYKKITAALKEDATSADLPNKILIQDKLMFADDALKTLLNPLDRALYIIKSHNPDISIQDSLKLEDYSVCNELREELHNCTNEEDVDLFQSNLKEQSEFIIQLIGTNIDDHKNYEAAASLIATWYELRDLYDESKNRKKQMQDGIVFVSF